jgi:hypothetical protein
MEEGAHGLDGKCLVQKSPVEKGTVYGIDALFKNKEIQGVGQMRYKDVNTRTIEREGIEYAAYLTIPIVGLTL